MLFFRIMLILELIRSLLGLFGIRKDLIDTKKSKLEVQKLTDEELARNLITRPTLADIAKYDTKFLRLEKKILREELREEIEEVLKRRGSFVIGGGSGRLSPKIKKLEKIIFHIRLELAKRFIKKCCFISIIILIILFFVYLSR